MEVNGRPQEFQVFSPQPSHRHESKLRSFTFCSMGDSVCDPAAGSCIPVTNQVSSWYIQVNREENSMRQIEPSIPFTPQTTTWNGQQDCLRK